jgi:hypothetical protein
MGPAYVLHLFSIGFKAVTAILGIIIAVRKRKIYGWYIALAFVIWVFCDIVKLLPDLRLRSFLTLPPNLFYLLCFVATLSILYAVWGIYKEK